MTLEFELRRSYGRDRFYPVNSHARTIVALTGRVCLTRDELDLLEQDGFIVALIAAEVRKV